MNKDYSHLYEEYTHDFRKGFVNPKYEPPKWIQFCDYLKSKGYIPKVYLSKVSVSKYVTFFSGDSEVKIRFSQHSPKYHDFDVNVGPMGLNYKQLIKLLEINL